jgi:aldose 1-epimerase
MFPKSVYILLINFFFLAFMSCNQQTDEQAETNNQVIAESVFEQGWPGKAAFADTLEGKNVQLFYLRNKQQTKALLTNYGARMIGMKLPSSGGQMVDVVLGFNTLDDYVKSGERYYGAVVGRYGNRIAKGRFILDGKSYQLDINNAPNSLHGGRTGFHSRLWDGIQADSQTVIFTYVSPDGEEGYPGKLITKVTYRLTDNNELLMDYEMETDKRTVINITNHNFWNLNGEGSGTVNDHELTIYASRFTPVDSTLIPVGISQVANTPLDFTKPVKIGERLSQKNQQLAFGGGYDHNFVLDKKSTMVPEPAALIKGDKTGIVMEILTTEPGIQLYGGNFMQGKHTLKNGARDEFRTAFCLETQHFPDSPNRPEFPSTILEPGKKYTSQTIHRFSMVK